MTRLVLVPLFLLSFSASAASALRDRDRETPARGRAVIVSPAHALSEADRNELAEKGIVIRHALPGGRYLARMRDAAGAVDDERVHGIESLTLEHKLDRWAMRAASSSRASVGVNVVFHADVPFGEAMQAILAAGGSTEPFTLRYLPSQRIEAKVPPSAVLALASDERVFGIVGRRNFKVTPNNAISATLSRVTELYDAPYGLSGAGVAVSLFELAAAQATHVEFQGRLTLASSVATGDAGDGRHATHVAGTIGAGGVRADAKGMAPKATIHQFCVKTANNKCTGLWLSHKEDRLAELNVVADNNSWGYVLGWQSGDPFPIWNGLDIYYGAYDLTIGAPIDKISNEQNVLFVHSSGNDGNLPAMDVWRKHRHVDDEGDEITTQLFCVSQNGSGTDCPTDCNGSVTPCELTIHGAATPFDTMGVTASAKNVVAVGSVNSAKNIVSSSSRGPAKDGRIKPDVVARGSGVLSAIPTNAYGPSSGTSMAAPAVTGIAALLTEQWRRTFAGADPKPAELKALLLAGAEDLGNPGPDYTYGFGLVNAKAAVDLIRADGGNGERIRTLSFLQGARTTTHEVALAVTSQQSLRVVLNWADPAIALLPGADTDIAEKALVNDLDVSIVDPAGNVHLAWVLDKNTPSANATRGVNKVDNVEMVEIANAVPGTYRVIATGTSVNEGPQTAVLVTNVRAARPCFDLQETGSGNNTADAAYGNLGAGSIVYGGLCSASDVDFYKFVATKTGPVSVTITTGDTALRVTLTGAGISRTQDVAANSTATLNADASSSPNAIILKIEPAGAIGAEPQYSFTPSFGVKSGTKRRSTRP